MGVEFPNSPKIGDIHRAAGRAWQWMHGSWNPLADIEDLQKESVDAAAFKTENSGAPGWLLSRTATGLKWVSVSNPGVAAIKAVFMGLRSQSNGPASFLIRRGICGTFDGSDIIHVDAPIGIDVNAALLDTGTLAADETYYIWILLNRITKGFIVRISLSKTSPTLPLNHVKGRMIGAIETNSDASGIVPFVTYNDGLSKAFVTASGTTTLNLAA